jgi:hypothetical protein
MDSEGTKEHPSRVRHGVLAVFSALVIVAIIIAAISANRKDIYTGVTKTELFNLETVTYLLCLNAVISIGTPAQNFSVLFDTGSTDFWIVASGCMGEGCGVEKKYSAELSSTSILSNEYSSIKYLDGSHVDYHIINDQVTLGTYKFSQDFGQAVNVSGHPLSGIIGIRVPGDKESKVDLTSNLLKTNLFPIGFSYDKIFQRNGQITLGSIDNNLFNGEINWMKLSSDRTNWYVTIDSITVQQQSSSQNLITHGSQGLFDTGTTLATLPLSIFAALNQANNNMFILQNGHYAIPCNSASRLKPITLKLGGAELVLDWYHQIYMVSNECRLTFQPAKDESMFLMGASFLMNFYVVFDLDEERIGLAVPFTSVQPF